TRWSCACWRWSPPGPVDRPVAGAPAWSRRQARTPCGMSRTVPSTITLTAPRNPAQADKRVDRHAPPGMRSESSTGYFQMTESFAELFEASQSHLAKLKPGAIVTGTVVQVRTDVVVINAGLKSEGIVPIEQFRNEAGEIDVAEGDVVKVAL